MCLRKGCGNRYKQHQRNQQFCNEPSCRAEVVRWQNAKRQQRWRQQPENRERQAQLARIRREKKKLEPKFPSLVVLYTCSCTDPTNVVASSEASYSASSRYSKLPENFCDRLGCYDATRDSQRNHGYLAIHWRDNVANVRLHHRLKEKPVERFITIQASTKHIRIFHQGGLVACKRLVYL